MDRFDGVGSSESVAGIDATGDSVIVPKAGPADLIATVWFRLGYRPGRSLVLLGLTGPRRRAGLMLRADLPSMAMPSRAVLLAFAADLMRSIAASGADEVFALVIEPTALDRPVSPLVSVLAPAAAQLDLHLVDVVGVNDQAYGSLICPDSRCCPPEGRPLTEVMASREQLLTWSPGMGSVMVRLI